MFDEGVAARQIEFDLHIIQKWKVLNSHTV